MIILSISLLSIGCTQQTMVDIERTLKQNFDCLSVQSSVFDVPPIIGGRQANYYCSFKDNANNDCYLIADSLVRDYILIYKNSAVESDKEIITSKYKDLFESILNPSNLPETDYITTSALESTKILKAKSNIGMFKDGNIGVMQITKHFIYRDEKLGKAIGPSEVSIVVLFDTTTKRYYQYDVGNKPKIIE